MTYDYCTVSCYMHLKLMKSKMNRVYQSIYAFKLALTIWYTAINSYIHTNRFSCLLSLIFLHWYYQFSHTLELIPATYTIEQAKQTIYQFSHTLELIRKTCIKNVQFFRAHIRTAHKDYFMWDLLFVIFNKEPYRERYIRYAI